MITKSKGATVGTYVYGGYYPSTHFHTGATNTNCPCVTIGQCVAPAPTSVAVPGDTITYENSGKRWFNYCLHTKDSFSQGVVAPYSYRVACTHNPLTYGGGYRFYVGAYWGASRPGAPAKPVVTENMRARAWQELLPQLESGFSLINFLWELKDIPGLLTSVARIGLALSKLPKELLRDGGTKTAAEMLLNWSFAIAPLKGDLDSIATILNRMDKAVNEFIAKGLVPQSYHYREVVSSSSTTVASTAYRNLTDTSKGEYFATLRCRYRYKKPGFLTSLLRLWGLRVTPEAIWNAIPFSFVVDWVFSVGDALRQFDRDTNVQVEIIDYCDTVKGTLVRAERNNAAGTACLEGTTWHMYCGGEGAVMWTWTRTIYERVPTLPNTGYYFPALDTLSMRELVLSAALLRALN